MEAIMRISGEMTPEKIIGKLSFFYEQIHHLHFNTTSFSEHKALDIWGDITDFKDKIGELLLGYITPKRFGPPESIQIDPYAQPSKVMDDIIDFAHKLDDWATNKKYTDLSNIAQELEGLAAKTKYMLTLR